MSSFKLILATMTAPFIQMEVGSLAQLQMEKLQHIAGLSPTCRQTVSDLFDVIKMMCSKLSEDTEIATCEEEVERFLPEAKTLEDFSTFFEAAKKVVNGQSLLFYNGFGRGSWIASDEEGRKLWEKGPTEMRPDGEGSWADLQRLGQHYSVLADRFVFESAITNERLHSAWDAMYVKCTDEERGHFGHNWTLIIEGLGWHYYTTVNSPKVVLASNADCNLWEQGHFYKQELGSLQQKFKTNDIDFKIHILLSENSCSEGNIKKLLATKDVAEEKLSFEDISLHARGTVVHW